MLRVIGNDINLPRQEPFIASGTLPNGKPILMNADGTAGGPFNATTIFSEEASTQIAIATSNSGTFVIMHTGPGGGYALRVRAGTISGNTVTLGDSVHVDGIESNLNAQGASIVYDPDNDKFVLFYPNGTNSYYLTSRVATVSGTSISLGTAVVVDSRNVLRVSADYDTSANKVVVAWRGLSGSNVAAAAVGTVSGTNISFGSTATLANRTVNTSINTVYDANANKTAVFYQDSATGHGYYVVGTVSGTSISGGSTAAFHAAATGGGIVAAYDPDSYKIVVAYVDGADSNKGKAIVGTISGTSMSFGSETQYSTTSGYDPGIAYDTANNKFFIFYDKNYGMAGRIGTVSGTSISVGSENVISSNNITDTGVVYDASAGKALLVYRDSGNSSYGTLQALDNSFALTNFTSESYIGISAGRNIVTSRTQALGSAAVFESGDAPQSDIAYDSTNNKVVIVYQDSNNSNHATAIVGTVDPSDNSITFGSSAVYKASATADNYAIFDSNSGKVVIAFYDGGNSNYGTAVVGTVSGTSISFGTPVVFNSGNATVNISMAFDSNSNKVVIAYKDQPQSNHGKAIVGTVSGTAISFGTEATYNAATTNETAATFDSVNNKVIIVYQDSGGNSGNAAAVVGTVSGTSISFGTPVVYTTNNSPNNAVTFDPVSGKVVAFYEHTSNATYGVVGTVSGTSISFGTAVQFGSDTTIASPIATFDASAGRVVLAYRGGNKGKAVAAAVSGTSLTFDTPISIFDNDATYTSVAYNSTNEKLVFSGRVPGANGQARVLSLGFNNISRGQVASGKTVLVDTQGAISKNHSALTPGQSYFVQSDGTLGTTADSPSVFAGTAISATELIVKG